MYDRDARIHWFWQANLFIIPAIGFLLLALFIYAGYYSWQSEFTEIDARTLSVTERCFASTNKSPNFSHPDDLATHQTIDCGLLKTEYADGLRQSGLTLSEYIDVEFEYRSPVDGKTYRDTQTIPVMPLKRRGVFTILASKTDPIKTAPKYATDLSIKEWLEMPRR